MPRASVPSSTERFDLETCDGGWVEIKRMSYGQKLDRADLAYKMSVEAEGANSAKKSAQAFIEASAKAVALFEFKHCVIDHNLFEDEAETQKLNFGAPDILHKLDPRIGEEIGTYIDKLNNFDPEGN